jgi:uncharacterized protein
LRAPYFISGRIIGTISFVIIVIAAFWLIWNGNTDIRYTADHEGTIPIWNKWVPAFISIVLIRFIPFRLLTYNPLVNVKKRLLTIEVAVFTIGAFLFTMLLLLVTSSGMELQVWFIVLKLIFLVVIPLFMFQIFKSNVTSIPKPASFTPWYWVGPIVVLCSWSYISFFSVYAVPSVSSGFTDSITLMIVLLISFFINSLLEELFYRVWLQTRLEVLAGRWPAIAFTSLLWASWHIAIQNTGELSVDIATVIVNQGITGLFLGYLWAKYRNVWILIAIHGLMNAPPHLLFEIFTM